MWEPSYQTVRLGVGRHPSPQHGACVMELASMLAHEQFTDHPRSVCPIIGAFLRGYNDWIDDRRRQDLYAYATRAVGTKTSKSVERERAQHCLTWFKQHHRGILRLCFPLGLGLYRRQHASEVAGAWAAEMASQSATDADHREALTLIDELIAIGQGPQAEHPSSLAPAPEKTPV